jgi:uncharacterized protein (DUF1501 family)
MSVQYGLSESVLAGRSRGRSSTRDERVRTVGTTVNPLRQRVEQAKAYADGKQRDYEAAAQRVTDARRRRDEMIADVVVREDAVLAGADIDQLVNNMPLITNIQSRLPNLFIDVLQAIRAEREAAAAGDQAHDLLAEAEAELAAESSLP